MNQAVWLLQLPSKGRSYFQVARAPQSRKRACFEVRGVTESKCATNTLIDCTFLSVRLPSYSLELPLHARAVLSLLEEERNCRKYIRPSSASFC